MSHLCFHLDFRVPYFFEVQCQGIIDFKNVLFTGAYEICLGICFIPIHFREHVYVSILDAACSSIFNPHVPLVLCEWRGPVGGAVPVIISLVGLIMDAPAPVIVISRAAFASCCISYFFYDHRYCVAFIDCKILPVLSYCFYLRGGVLAGICFNQWCDGFECICFIYFNIQVFNIISKI